MKIEAKTRLQAAAIPKKISNVLNAFENMYEERRAKSWEVYPKDKEIEYITQESDDTGTIAKQLAKMLKSSGCDGWVVKVALRDNYVGEKTKWQKAKT